MTIIVLRVFVIRTCGSGKLCADSEIRRVERPFTADEPLLEHGLRSPRRAHSSILRRLTRPVCPTRSPSVRIESTRSSKRLDVNQAECVQHLVMSRLRATSTLIR